MLTRQLFKRAFLKTKRTRSKALRIITYFIILSALSFASISMVMSIKYALPFAHIAKGYVRFALLGLIYLSTEIYDPSFAHKAVLAPDYKLFGVSFEDCDRIEVFLSDNDIKPRVLVKLMDNKLPIHCKYPFSYQPFNEPRLAALRTKYGLDQVVASARDEFEGMFLLLSWTRSQFRRHDYQTIIPSFDALTLLDRNLRNSANEPFRIGKHYDPCSFFPRLYSQVILSMGHQPRLVHVTDTGYIGHGMVEVWSNQYNKWIAMDVELDLYYEKNGMPLNLLEIHNERYRTGRSTVRIVRGNQRSGDLSTTMAFLKKENLDIEWAINYHKYFRILDMRNDWITNNYFRGHPQRSDLSKLTFVDKSVPPIFELGPTTDNKDLFYWTLNQTEILAKKGNRWDYRLQLVFKTSTPNFKHFKVNTDLGTVFITDSPLFEWILHPGDNMINVRSVNSYGIDGVPSSVRIDVK